MVVHRFCRNIVGPPEWGCEAISFVVWVQCANLCRVCDASRRGIGYVLMQDGKVVAYASRYL